MTTCQNYIEQIKTECEVSTNIDNFDSIKCFDTISKETEQTKDEKRKDYNRMHK